MTGTWGLIECLFLDIESVLQCDCSVCGSGVRKSPGLRCPRGRPPQFLVLFKYLCSFWLSSDRRPAGNGIVVASHNNGVL